MHKARLQRYGVTCPKSSGTTIFVRWRCARRFSNIVRTIERLTLSPQLCILCGTTAPLRRPMLTKTSLRLLKSEQ